MELVTAVERVGSQGGTTSQRVVIVKSGELAAESA